VRRLYSELRGSGGRGGLPLSGTIVHNIDQVLHTALQYGVRIGDLCVNPAGRVEKPRNDTEERVVYTPEEVALLGPR